MKYLLKTLIFFTALFLILKFLLFLFDTGHNITYNVGNFKIKEIPMKMKERDGGKSSITPLKSIYYAIKVGLAVMLACVAKEKEV